MQNCPLNGLTRKQSVLHTVCVMLGQCEPGSVASHSFAPVANVEQANEPHAAASSAGGITGLLWSTPRKDAKKGPKKGPKKGQLSLVRRYGSERMRGLDR